MTHTHKRQLRMLRRRWALTQTEVAFLIGAGSGAVVSRIEDHKRTPSLAAALGCELLFGIPLSELFSGSLANVGPGVLERAYVLYDELQGNPSQETRLKLDFLESVFARLEKKGQTP